MLQHQKRQAKQVYETRMRQIENRLMRIQHREGGAGLNRSYQAQQQVDVSYAGHNPQGNTKNEIRSLHRMVSNFARTRDSQTNCFALLAESRSDNNNACEQAFI